MADRLASEEPLTIDEKEMVENLLREQIVRPKKKRGVGRPEGNGPDIMASFLVLYCVGLGRNPFRNETSDAQSACDIVAEAYRRTGNKPTSYSGVKAAFLHFRKTAEIKWTKKP